MPTSSREETSTIRPRFLSSTFWTWSGRLFFLCVEKGRRWNGFSIPLRPESRSETERTKCAQFRRNSKSKIPNPKQIQNPKRILFSLYCLASCGHGSILFVKMFLPFPTSSLNALTAPSNKLSLRLSRWPLYDNHAPAGEM